MHIVFYSTNSNSFDGADYKIRSVPSRQSEWEQLARVHGEHRITLATQLPGSFLLDLSGNQIAQKAAGVDYVILKGKTAAAVAKEIAALKADLAVAVSFWERPFDYLALNDALIAQELRKAGIRTICHSAQSEMTCFDKSLTRDRLRAAGFATAESVFVKRELYWCERGNSAIENNVYKEYIFAKLQELHYPVIVKPAYGLSSYSMLKAVSPKQVIACLNSGKTKTDSLVEEFIEGEQFGTEIYGTDGNYAVMPPFMFSVDKWGITSPKQGIKIGPLVSDLCRKKYKLDALEEQLQHLARELELQGIAQVDLVFAQGTWYIIEVNPRLSGMTQTYAAALGIPPGEILFHVADGTVQELLPRLTADCLCNFKIPLLDDATLDGILTLPFILYSQQLHNIAAKQLRERGYSEVIIRGDKDPASIVTRLQQLEERFPGTVDPVFLQNVRDITQKLR